jgi:hypothetical protein
MGLFDWFLNLFRPKPGETPADVSDRLHRFGDRCRNAGDPEGERAARAAADDARLAPDTAAAIAIEHAFLRARGLGPDGRPPKPIRGQLANGPAYVRYGDRIRSGGSRSWRYNNPGYVRCSSRSASYGAIGCDGEYAIFPDERTGRYALVQTLRHDYPHHTVRDALREHLPPEANPAAVGERLERSGLDLTAPVETLSHEQLHAAADVCCDAGGWESGEVLDRESSEASAPAWSEVWSAPVSGGEPGPDEDPSPTDPQPTDNS